MYYYQPLKSLFSLEFHAKNVSQCTPLSIDTDASYSKRVHLMFKATQYPTMSCSPMLRVAASVSYLWSLIAASGRVQLAFFHITSWPRPLSTHIRPDPVPLS